MQTLSPSATEATRQTEPVTELNLCVINRMWFKGGGMLCRKWWSAVLSLLCARMPCAPVVECKPPCLIKPCCVLKVWFIQFRETQQELKPAPFYPRSNAPNISHNNDKTTRSRANIDFTFHMLHNDKIFINQFTIIGKQANWSILRWARDLQG